MALHEPQPGMVGIINRKTCPVRVCRQAIHDALLMCERALGDAPQVTVIGDESFTFNYIDSHIHHVVFELIKNAARAVVERYGANSSLGHPMPSIRVIVAAGASQEDVVIKVSDEGGGIPRSGIDRIWSYFFTSYQPALAAVAGDETAGADFSTNTPLAGLGYGLPMSRMYARYFGGDLQVISIAGYGTDAFVFLKRVGDADEPVPHLSIPESG